MSGPSVSVMLDVWVCHGKHDPRDVCVRCGGGYALYLGRLHAHAEPPHEIHVHGPPYMGEEEGLVTFLTAEMLEDPELPEHVADEIREQVEATRLDCRCGEPGEEWCSRCAARVALGLPDDWPGLQVGQRAKDDPLVWNGSEWVQAALP